MKPKIYKCPGRGTWMLRIGRDEWYCYLGWVGAVGFLKALYHSGDVERIQRRSAA